MKTALAYEVLYFFQGIYFWIPLNIECLILEIKQIYTLSNLLNGVLHFDFTILFKKWAKKKRRWYLSEEKKQKKNKIMLR